MLHNISYPRAALIGNPSDGYYGKTISFVFSNFKVIAQLTPSEKIILDNGKTLLHYTNFEYFKNEIQKHDFEESSKLLQASLMQFLLYVEKNELRLSENYFTLNFLSNIPFRLGLAGSSAIITALMKNLFEFYELDISPAAMAMLVLKVETEQLGIGAGLQDRVAQAFEKPMMMNFDKTIMDKGLGGEYQKIAPELIPPVYIAYRNKLEESSAVLHNNLRERFENNDTEVIEAMQTFAQITDQAYAAMQVKDYRLIKVLMDANFDLRQSISKISPGNLEMIELARRVGASAKFTGSGGSIIGVYDDEEMYHNLSATFIANDIQILKPTIVNHD